MPLYKLLSYQADQDPRSGMLIGDQVYDIAEITGREAFALIDNILRDWTMAEPLLDAAAEAPSGIPKALADVRLLAPVLRPGAIYCAGANYQDHIDNMARMRKVDMGEKLRDLGLPPYHFMKSPHCIVGTDIRVIIDSRALDYEGELAAVIGRDAFDVAVGDALSYVAGYTVANDMSARDRFMRPGIPLESPFRYDWIGHKNFDGSCPTGPFLVPAKFIRDPQDLRLRTWVNGEMRQDSSTANMIYSLAELIAALSCNITLRPGDLVLTGTPAGVAAETGNFLKAGDLVKVEIESIGAIQNEVGG